jgi:hypothetical protein
LFIGFPASRFGAVLTLPRRNKKQLVAYGMIQEGSMHAEDFARPSASPPKGKSPISPRISFFDYFVIEAQFGTACLDFALIFCPCLHHRPAGLS